MISLVDVAEGERRIAVVREGQRVCIHVSRREQVVEVSLTPVEAAALIRALRRHALEP